MTDKAVFNPLKCAQILSNRKIDMGFAKSKDNISRDDADDSIEELSVRIGEISKIRQTEKTDSDKGPE